MFRHQEDYLICPYCQASLAVVQKITNGLGIVGCGCSSYPVVYDIYYLKKDKLAQKAVYLLKKGRGAQALVTLLNLRRLFLYLVLSVIYLNGFFKKIGFRKTIGFLSLFSNSKEWFWYLVNRKKIPSYYISRLGNNLIKKSGPCVADLGCGVGHTLTSNAFGVDKLFVNLILAKIFFATSQNTLVCADLEKKLPFKTGVLDLITSTDTFHYLRNKSTFLSETERCLSPSGALAIVHTLNICQKGNIFGLTPNKLKVMAEKVGFKKSTVLSNETIWEKMLQKKNSLINFGFPDPNLGKCYAFNLFAAKKDFFDKVIVISALGDKPITYRHDVELTNYLNLQKLLMSYDNYIFFSPHFDDAVLSCGLLLETLQKNHKNTLVVTVFTKGSPKPYSREARVFVRKSGYNDAEKLFADRVLEDENVMKYFKVKFLHLDYIDAVFRNNNPSVSFAKIKITPKTLLLAPLGVGEHFDHILVNNLVRKLNQPVIFWEDFPYNTHPYFVRRFFRWNFKYRPAFNLENYSNAKKILAIKMYSSQINVLFRKKEIPDFPEKYFYLKDSKIFENSFAELSGE